VRDEKSVELAQPSEVPEICRSHADDVERLRTKLGLERWGVVAHSAGTCLAIAYAAQFADRLAALLLITSPASYLVDVASDASTLSAARMAPAFAAAIIGQLLGLHDLLGRSLGTTAQFSPRSSGDSASVS